eukprot:4235420-Prymnesium_polylepis.1
MVLASPWKTAASAHSTLVRMSNQPMSAQVCPGGASAWTSAGGGAAAGEKGGGAGGRSGWTGSSSCAKEPLPD